VSVRPRPGDLVLVVWTDIEHHSGWTDWTNEWCPDVYQSVGWLVRADRERVVIAGTAARGTDDGKPYTKADCLHGFPRGAVVSLSRLVPA
jgi:hypothetical protein